MTEKQAVEKAMLMQAKGVRFSTDGLGEAGNNHISAQGRETERPNPRAICRLTPTLPEPGNTRAIDRVPLDRHTSKYVVYYQCLTAGSCSRLGVP
jgi:hypothetical protein